MNDEDPYSARDVAEYLRDLSKELSRIATEAGLSGTAAALDLAYHAAAREREQASSGERGG